MAHPHHGVGGGGGGPHPGGGVLGGGGGGGGPQALGAGEGSGGEARGEGLRVCQKGCYPGEKNLQQNVDYGRKKACGYLSLN